MTAPTPEITKEEEPFISHVSEDAYPENLIAILGPYKKRMGFILNALKLCMHRPKISETLWTLNNKIMQDPSATLDPSLKCKLAAVASNINGCAYCTSHTCGTLQNSVGGCLEGWDMDDRELTQLLSNPRNDPQNDPEPEKEMEDAWFAYVQAASFDPSNVPRDVLGTLKKHLTPPQIIELACVTGFSKMYNTIHDNLHIPLEAHLLDMSGYVDV